MNYIKRLQAENDALRQGYTDLQTYLLSDKFSRETWVDREDILLRIMETLQAVGDVQHRRGA